MRLIVLKYKVLLLIMTICLITLPIEAMQAISDNELDSCTAQAGISIILDEIETALGFDAVLLGDSDGAGSGTNAGYLTIPNFQMNYGIYRLDDPSITKIGDDPATSYDYAGIQYRPLTLDIPTAAADVDVNGDSVVDIPAGRTILWLGLPTVQMAFLELNPMEVKVTNNPLGTGGAILGTLTMQGNYLEFLGGTLGVTSHTDGSSGLDIYFSDAKFFWNTKLFKIEAVEGNYDKSFSLRNFLLHGTDGGPYTISSSKLSIDMYTDSSGRHIVQADFPYWNDNMNMTLGQMDYCGENFGTWYMNNIQLGDNAKIRLAGKNDGLDLEIAARFDIGNLEYRYGSGASYYNDSQGIHLAGTMSGPSTTWNPGADWSFSNNFQFGNFDNGSPVSVDVVTNSAGNHSYLQLTAGSVNMGYTRSGIGGYTVDSYNPPISGSLAIENIRLNTNNYGAVIFRGLDISYLKITMPMTPP